MHCLHGRPLHAGDAHSDAPRRHPGEQAVRLHLLCIGDIAEHTPHRLPQEPFPQARFDTARGFLPRFPGNFPADAQHFPAQARFLRCCVRRAHTPAGRAP